MILQFIQILNIFLFFLPVSRTFRPIHYIMRLFEHFSTSILKWIYENLLFVPLYLINLLDIFDSPVSISNFNPYITQFVSEVNWFNQYSRDSVFQFLTILHLGLKIFSSLAQFKYFFRAESIFGQINSLEVILLHLILAKVHLAFQFYPSIFQLSRYS